MLNDLGSSATIIGHYLLNRLLYPHGPTEFLEEYCRILRHQILGEDDNYLFVRVSRATLSPYFSFHVHNGLGDI